MHIEVTDPVTEYFRITPVQKVALKKLGIITIKDLLYYFPVRYGDTAEARSIDTLAKGDSTVIYGKIDGLEASKGFKSKMTMATGTVEDDTGKVSCVWFNQPYIAKMYTPGMLVRIEGKVSEKRDGGKLYFSNPKIERVDHLPTGVGDSLFGADGEAHTLYPVYPESRGISSLWLYHSIQKLFKNGILDKVPEVIPEDILTKYSLPGIKSALIWMHVPMKRDDALSARKRFSFEEIFLIQLGKHQVRKEYEHYPAFAIDSDNKHVTEFIKRFPFTATDAQNIAINAILGDMERTYPMSRLLEGDVGSGKTAVAAATAYAVVAWRPGMKKAEEKTDGEDGVSINSAPVPKTPQAIKLPVSTRLQIAYMCPTEILATQHFESFIQYFAYLGVQIGLITSSGCRKFPSKVNPKGWTDISRSQLLEWVANGEIPIVIGTHSLIQKTVKFKHLAYVIIDEQHRFGTAQRSALAKKNLIGNSSTQNTNKVLPPAPHLLSMTATPIPRTLALTIYGDLDLTLIDQPPAGRKPILTEIVPPSGRDAVYEKARLELERGRQMYVICPRIDEPDPEKEMALNARSVKEEAKRLKEKVFTQYEIGILHSRMKPNEKDAVMAEFKSGKIHILCATSVVEVGVNVPNATVILIEGAERFGLAQLHQLRGRVQRSSHQAYCYAFTETTSQKSIERLTALRTAKNGFELAELDLAQRGSGQLSGAKQWGVSDVAMEALKNLKMVEAARTEAKILIDEDITLTKYPILKKAVEERKKGLHME
ncbi:MAG: ATP-dependent DNA helicase RecG [Candidatus Paceibacterota bacterium]